MLGKPISIVHNVKDEACAILIIKCDYQTLVNDNDGEIEESNDDNDNAGDSPPRVNDMTRHKQVRSRISPQ